MFLPACNHQISSEIPAANLDIDLMTFDDTDATEINLMTFDESDDFEINLKDPSVEKAAVLLQAGFRGLKARQTFKAKKVQHLSMLCI